ncbi:MAG: hypothetical protein ACP5IA_11600 [Sediminispirochaetaceae bacterium]
MKRPADNPADRDDNLKERWYRNCQVCPHRCVAGARFTTAEDYFSRCREAVLEMHRQVGDLSTGPRGTPHAKIIFPGT